MQSSTELLLALAGVLALGLLSTALGRRSFLPRVTLLLLFGLAIGDSGLRLLPEMVVTSFGFIADTALVMIGFLIGSQISSSTLRNATRDALFLSIIAALMTALVTFSGLVLAGVAPLLAVILGCIASATDAAAVLDVVEETERRGRFSRLLLAVVALDDVWALLLFSIGMALVASWSGYASGSTFLLHAGREILGAVGLGLVLGIPAAFLTGRVRPGQPMMTEALALVFLCAGLSLWLGVSYLIAAITLGIVVANRAKHHDYAFHAIEDVEQPFLILFFVLAGASLEVAAVRELGLAGLVYLVCRGAGKVTGVWLGSVPARTDAVTRRWMGIALLPQAGIAIGMALVAANYYPEYANTLLTLVVASTVVFELIGPLCTRLALVRTRAATSPVTD